MDRYLRADVLRILHISAKQLLAWEKAELFPFADSYSFSDLVQLGKLRDLRAKRVRPAVIRESLEAMQRQVSGMTKPLLEAGIFSTGSRVAFRHQGAAVEPIAGQFVLDFAPPNVVETSNVRLIRPDKTASQLFAQGVALEETCETQHEAVAMYLKAIERDPRHAAAYINLGTLYYNQQNFDGAETCYRKAIESDPNYALAYFDLGNVLDETGRLADAVVAYKSALAIARTYGDAHYNLALAYERLKQPRRALRHWRAYLKIDRLGPWAAHAKAQATKILEAETLRIVCRYGVLVDTD